MGRVLLLIWKRPNFTRWNKESFKFKSIQAQYGLTTGLHTRAESFYAQQRHTALGKEVHFIFLNLVIFFHWQYTIKYQEYWMLCFKYSPDCRAMNYLLLLVQKKISKLVFKTVSFYFPSPNIILNCLELKLFSFIEMTLQPVYSVHVGVLKDLVLHADKEKEPY